VSLRLEDLANCFQGVIPAMIATCGKDGEPNVTYLSQVYYVGPRHVALSCQFFNKTKRNVTENPFATVIVQDPRVFDAYRLQLRFDHIETSGALFDTMAARIQVIASHTGMAGVFRLLSADVYEVLSLEALPEYLLPADPVLDAAVPCEIPGPLTELRGLQAVSERVARADGLECLLHSSLAALDEVFSFRHSMILVPEDSGRRLVTLASHGYGDEGVGAEVAVGQGVIGTAAERKRMVRVAGIGGELRYGRAIRERMSEAGESARLAAEIPLPGLPDAQAQLALPLLSAERLVGVLAVESTDPMRFDEWDEAFLQIVANQIAAGMDRMQNDEEDSAPASAVAPSRPTRASRRTFLYYRADECVFVDGEYLIRNVPGKILWKLLNLSQESGQVEFTNRELRLDPWLGLPSYKDNLESRLILLRKRLQAKCPEVRMVPVRRGRFALELACAVELVEKETP
jgi:adenylate cyclase